MLEQRVARLELLVAERDAQVEDLQARLDEARQEVVRALAKLQTVASRAEAASAIAEAEIAVQALRAATGTQPGGGADVAQAGTLLQQAALHVGPLSVSQPFLVITDPFASIILSVWLFDERFTDSPAKITVAVLAFAVMAVGVTMLTRTAPEDLTPS